MKKLVVLIGILALFAGISVSACHSKKNEEVRIASNKIKEIDVLPTMNSESSSPNRIWVGTFQIVWNELIDNITKNPIEFIGGTNQTAENLNRREFNKTDISENSYFTKYGIVSPELKEEIEKGIKEKFNETSDILGAFDFRYNPQKMFFYAMLKKDFKFLKPFDKLSEEKFGNNPNLVKYFGIKRESDEELYGNVSVLFYNSESDMAVKLYTKDNDEVILYRTDDDKKFNEYFEDLMKKSEGYNEKYFGSNDRLKVPDIKLYQETNFSDLEGKSIKNTDLRIDRTLETVDFRMDNEGVKLKSEAAIMMKATSVGPGMRPRIRYFYFNDNFVLFLIEKGKTVPYFALRVNDVETLNRTGKAD